MMNENTFTKNFRSAFASQSPRLLTPKEQTTPTFQKVIPTFQKFPEKPADYGSQQNAIGLTALSIVLGGLGYTPAAIAAALAAGSQADKAHPQIRARRLDNNYNSEDTMDRGIIDKTPALSPLLQGLTPIPVDGGYEDTLKVIEENEKTIQKIRDSLNVSDQIKGRR